MDTDRKTLEQVAVDDRNEFDDRSSLGTVLIVSGDEEWAASIGKMLNDNLYGTSVALNGDQIIDRLIKHWYHLILIDLDSIDVFENYLIRYIRKIEPDIPIIGMGESGGRPLEYWLTTSFLFSKPEYMNRYLRSPLLIGSLMLFIRLVLFPLLWVGNLTGRGDCLVVEARKI